jgi:hypothetical protein
MKQGAIIETVCDAQEWYPGLLTPMCDELATFGFVWGSLAVLLTDLRQSQGNNLLTEGLCPLGGQSTLRVAGLAEVEWCEPHFPDQRPSQLPARRTCSASNSAGGRYPRLECNLLWL